MQQIISLVRKGHDMLVKILDYARDPFLLIIRLYWGYQFFLAGKGKLENLERTAGFLLNYKFHCLNLMLCLLLLQNVLGGCF